MLRIRLARVGKKRQPYYRVVVADIESKRDGRIVERIGHYTPLTDPGTYEIDEERALYWLSVGAQPSDAVRSLLNKQGTFARLKRLHAGESIESLVSEYKGEATVAAGAEEATAEGIEPQAVAEAAAVTGEEAVAAVAVEEE